MWPWQNLQCRGTGRGTQTARGLMYYLQLENLNRADSRGWSKDSRLYDCGIKTDMPEFLLSLLLLLGTPGRAGPACVCVSSHHCATACPATGYLSLWPRRVKRPQQKAVWTSVGEISLGWHIGHLTGGDRSNKQADSRHTRTHTLSLKSPCSGQRVRM